MKPVPFFVEIMFHWLNLKSVPFGFYKRNKFAIFTIQKTIAENPVPAIQQILFS